MERKSVFIGGVFVKNRIPVKCCDEICGKETKKYIGEFSPYRLTVIRTEEKSEPSFTTEKKNRLSSAVMTG